MSGIPLVSLRLDPRSESDLRWFFSQEWRGELGLHSPMGGDLERASHEVEWQRGKPSRHGSGWMVAREMDDRVLAVADRVNGIIRRLRQLSPEQRQTLEVVYEPQPPGAVEGLEAWPAHLAALVLESHAAAVAHRQSRSRKELVVWLRRLSWRAQTGQSSTVEADRARVRALREAAEGALVRACRAYSNARRAGR